MPELDRLGHRSIAVDLPCDDATATFDTYADVIAEVIAGEPEDIVVVGHSLAGLTIPLVASRAAVGRMVFLCALVASPGISFLQQLETEPDMLFPRYEAGLRGPDERNRTQWVDFEVAREVFFADCEQTDARWAFDHLRPQGRSAYSQPCALDSLPDVPMTYVLCRDDALVNPAWSRRAATERLAVEPVVLPGSHSPFLSRPAELAEVLHTL
jgi:pimeloyl-ACP methyl ester carboxylesterase